jgi:protein-S-isoprenylcysteine O-methyltransferase Ste14
MTRTSFLDHRVPPPALMGAIALLMGLLAWAAPGPAWPEFVRVGVAGALATAGLGFNAAGFRTIRRAGSTIDPTRPDAASALVVGGPFRISRNPMYVGFTLMLLAWAAWLQTPWAFAGPVVFALYLTRWQIVPEERALRAKFGASYAAYEARVRRWL